MKAVPALFKATKVSYARKAELIEAGLDWMNYYFDELPNEGTISVSQRAILEFKKQLPFKIPNDCCRHTFSSNIIAYSDDPTYWNQRVGHDDKVQKIHYSNPPNHEEAKEFYGLNPKAVLEDNPKSK